MVLVKNGHFLKCFFLGTIGQENVFYGILESKNNLLFDKKKSLKCRKIHIFPKGLVQCFGQKWPFFNLFFLGNIGQENVFYGILESKNNFLFDKKKSSKSRNIDIFSKGLVHRLVKNGHFSNLFFQAIQARKMCFMIFQNKKTYFQAIKIRSLKSRKIAIFSKGLVHGFGPKWPFIQHIFFRQYRLGKCVLWFSRIKKHFFLR